MRICLHIDGIGFDQIQSFVHGNEGETVTFLNGNSADETSLIAVGVLDVLELKSERSAFDQLKTFVGQKKDWYFGYMSYDLKNDVEKLTSKNNDGLEFPVLHFYRPRFVIKWDGSSLSLSYDNDFDTELSARQWLGDKIETKTLELEMAPVEMESRETRTSYLEKIEALQQHIQVGDIYEINFCQEFYAEHVDVNPIQLYAAMNKRTKAPFSCFYQHGDFALMSASPERFLKKQGQRIVSQPIKGTIRRGVDEREDQLLKEQLFNDPKERGENVMIVDLVRNDLSRTAKKGSVKVDELFGIYSFETVHQMISTVSSELRDDCHLIDAIKAAFPMGSMTGAPKVCAMQLIEEHEITRRGLYSGAVGYISPEGDADFNVVIRSLLYNSKRQYLSLMVGGAITARSQPELEYEECLLKAEAIIEVLQGVSSAVS